MHAAVVKFPAEVRCAQDSPSLTYFMYTVYVQIPSVKGGYSFVTRYAKKLEMKGSTLWPVFVAFFKAMFLQEQPKKTQAMQEPILQLYEVVPFENTYPKGWFSQALQAPCVPLFLHVLSLREKDYFRSVFVSGMCPSLQESICYKML